MDAEDLIRITIGRHRLQPADVEDLAQEIRIAIWRATLTWRPDGGRTLRNWCWLAARLRRREWWRVRRGRTFLVPHNVPWNDGLRLDREPSPSAAIEQQETVQTVRAAVARLSPGQQEAIEGLLAGETAHAVAARRAVSAGTLYAQRTFARRMLKRQLVSVA